MGCGGPVLGPVVQSCCGDAAAVVLALLEWVGGAGLRKESLATEMKALEVEKGKGRWGGPESFLSCPAPSPVDRVDAASLLRAAVGGAGRGWRCGGPV